MSGMSMFFPVRGVGKPMTIPRRGTAWFDIGNVKVVKVRPGSFYGFRMVRSRRKGNGRMNIDTSIETGARGASRGERRAAFIRDIAAATATLVVEALKPALERAGASDGAFRAYRTREACNLTGLRLRQFERFCEIMKAKPTEAPFRAAQAVLGELQGRGGYPCASSLQRYAIKHRRHW